MALSQFEEAVSNVTPSNRYTRRRACVRDGRASRVITSRAEPAGAAPRPAPAITTITPISLFDPSYMSPDFYDTIMSVFWINVLFDFSVPVNSYFEQSRV